MRRYPIAAIPADGIGPEVIGAGLEVLIALSQRGGDFWLDITRYDWGSDQPHGKMMPDDGLEQLKAYDAIYFGAVETPDIPDHVTFWGLRLAICQGFDQYANVRPTLILPGSSTPLRGKGDLDWGDRPRELGRRIRRAWRTRPSRYAGRGGNGGRHFHARAGVARIMRYAFRLAQSRHLKLLTVVTKSNAQRHGMVMWDEIAAAAIRGANTIPIGTTVGNRL